ncbi:hypothetical protein [Rhodoblastus sp.]|uniref:hypothetical protein n=1 Tax=Rhodoblastus sp. TaxID=1962975 RepID=UPI003F9DF8EF
MSNNRAWELRRRKRHSPYGDPKHAKPESSPSSVTTDNNAKRPTPDSPKPDLVIRHDDPTTTARRLSEIISQSGCAFDRAGPVQVFQHGDDVPRVTRLSTESVVIFAHELARPVTLNSDGKPTAKALPDRVARLYLAMGEWGLQPLRGITSAPLLADNGAIRSFEGYDPSSGFWLHNVPELSVSKAPTFGEAQAALRRLRTVFRSFPFADAILQDGGAHAFVDLDKAPRQDESAFLAALLTATCRSSLPLAPGLLISAPSISGAGTGKGLLVRAICAIALGIEPHAFTAGRDTTEFDKRIASALIEATQVVFVDNANGEILRSDLLASILTERRVDVRPLGSSRMLPLCPNAFVAITGNGVTLSEDLARRFVVAQLDAHTEDPEARPFPPGFLRTISQRRSELLSSSLTIWRWGRLNDASLKYGRPLGSFEEWGRWVRDPLLALGCSDPVERVSAIKAQDPMRRAIGELFAEWWRCHESRPLKAADLADSVRAIIDPQGAGRQFVASYLAKLAGTRAGGFALTAQRAAGKWAVTTYALRQLDDDPPPMPPMVPMP